MTLPFYLKQQELMNGYERLSLFEEGMLSPGLLYQLAVSKLAGTNVHCALMETDQPYIRIGYFRQDLRWMAIVHFTLYSTVASVRWLWYDQPIHVEGLPLHSASEVTTLVPLFLDQAEHLVMFNGVNAKLRPAH